MRVFVTGCAGFIGYHLSRALLADGVEVLGVDDLNDAYDTRLKDWRLAQLRARRGFEFVRADIASPGALDRIDGSGVERVYHLAARAGVRQSLLTPRLYLDTNIHGALHVLEWCRRNDVGTMLLASTSSLYGRHNTPPFHESANTDLPLSPYAASKKGAEALAASYAHLYGLHTPVPRFFTVYGPAGRPDMSVFIFTQAIAEGRPIEIHGDGKQTRDFTYVEDIVRGVRLLAEKVRGHEVVNLGGDQPTALLEMVGKLESALGKKAELRFGQGHPADVPATWADIGRARALGWSPQTGLDEGIKRTVDWYLQERSWAGGVRAG